MAALRRTLNLAAAARRAVAGREGGQREGKLGCLLHRSLVPEIVPLKAPGHIGVGFVAFCWNWALGDASPPLVHRLPGW